MVGGPLGVASGPPAEYLRDIAADQLVVAVSDEGLADQRALDEGWRQSGRRHVVAGVGGMTYLEGVLPHRISESETERAHRVVLREAISVLTADTAPAIPDLAARLAVSERHLRALFSAGVGVSPKHFARIDRVRRVLAYAGETPWSHLAAHTGYYDQSHLTADFRTLMGVPPAAYLRGSLPAPTRCRIPR